MDLTQNEKIKAYMDLVCSQIKFKKIHKNIKEELVDHLSNLVEENMEKGLSLEEAINMGIKQMGDPYAVGQDLNKIHKPKPEWSILALTLVFTLIGMIAIYALSSEDLILGWSTRGIMKNSITMVILGMVTILALYFFDYRKIKPISKYIYIITSLFLVSGKTLGEICGGFGIFKVIRGSVMIFSTDLAYIVPFLYAIALSGIFAENRWKKDKIISNLVILFLPVILIIAFQMSKTAPIMMYFAMVLVLILVSGGGINYILGSMGIGVIGVIFLVASSSYKIERFKSFLNPFKDPLGHGYINVQLRKLISSAGFLGNGMNIDKTELPILNLPGMHTNYIFSYIIYVFGWLIGIFIIILSITFFIRLIKTAREIKDDYGKLLVATFSSLFIVQFVYNILMIFGLVPLTDISMPFISYGTTLNMVNMVMIGIISSVYRRKEVVAEKSF